MKRGTLVALLLSLVGVGGIWTANAATFTSPSYSINGNLGDSAAGAQSSTSYKLTSAAGESIAGNTSSASYKLGQGYVNTLENSIQVDTQPNGLLAYFPFEEATSKTTFDNSSASHIGELVGDAQFSTGKNGSGLFNPNARANGSGVKIANATSLRPSGAITVSGWAKQTDTNNSYTTAIAKSTTGSDSYGFYTSFDAVGKPRFAITTSAGSVDIGPASSPYADNQWHFFSGTWDGNTMRMYIDGVQVATGSQTGTISYSSSDLWILGSHDYPSESNKGGVDEIKLYNRALSAAEVKAEYTASNAGLAAGLAFAAITPGVSQTSSFDSIVQTSAGGYTLAINQNNNLTSGGNTIPAVSGSIASPVSWSEGTTKGLGFTLFGTNATAIPGTWSSGSAYAALPGAATSFYSRSNYTGGAKDVLNMRLRLDAQSSQAAGEYANQMTITGTMIP